MGRKWHSNCSLSAGNISTKNTLYVYRAMIHACMRSTLALPLSPHMKKPYKLVRKDRASATFIFINNATNSKAYFFKLAYNFPQGTQSHRHQSTKGNPCSVRHKNQDHFPSDAGEAFIVLHYTYCISGFFYFTEICKTSHIFKYYN